jgi:hypothetical protein
MKKIFCPLFLGIFTLFFISAFANAENEDLASVLNCLTTEDCISAKINDEDIYPGKGYSLETRQLSRFICYDTTVRYAHPQGAMRFSSAMSYNDLVKMFTFDASANLNLSFFSSDAKLNYLKSIQDTSYSYSLSYGQYAMNTVYIEPKSFGIETLNNKGKKIFEYYGINSKFNKFCGDSFITSYKQGAIIIMSLNLIFDNMQQKEEFKAHIGSSVGNIARLAADIQKIAASKGVNVKMAVQAYQRGGDPTQLAQIIDKDPSGQYYSITCNIYNMNDCVRVANGVFKYAADVFPKQFSLKDQQGFDSLGLNFIKYTPIDMIGLDKDEKPTKEIL